MLTGPKTQGLGPEREGRMEVLRRDQGARGFRAQAGVGAPGVRTGARVLLSGPRGQHL